ncbi:hypothetical protein ANN_25745 [Periplaneta americana]|uniref:CCHC-type domain-containing protein n=1 Tax=Periplaneta americana TaxID=6978 RepID=A0ABQ8S4C5_PERAM|nr:hypothetical protein ANN_25745 [Periplaneta americana]
MDTINRNLQIENYNRKNTIKIQFAQSATRPSAQEIHQWIVKKMVINTDQVDTLQLHNRERAIYLKYTILASGLQWSKSSTNEYPKNIPATIQVASYTANITYPGQPQACFVCGDTTHMKQDCPQRTVSLRLQPRNTPRLLSEVVKFNLSEPQNTDVNTAVDEFSENKSLRNDDENSDLQCITNVHETMDTNTNALSISSTPPTEALIRCKRPIPPRKVKKVKPPTLDEQLHPVKHILEATPSEFILNYTQLKSLYENTVGVTDILKVALSYTNDTEGLIEMLQKLYPHYQDKGIKNRTTRIENCLRAIISMESDNNGETDAVDNIQTPIHP